MIRLRAVPALALALILVSAATAHADAAKCEKQILVRSAKLVQVSAAALRRCRDKIVKRDLPVTTDCRTEPATSAKIAAATQKLVVSIDADCGGTDHQCATTADNMPLSSIGWAIGTCPDFQGHGCTAAINNCADVATCVACVDTTAVEQAMGLFDDLEPAADRVVASCRRAVGKATAKFLGAESKALRSCATAVLGGSRPGPCPDANAGAKIAKAAAKRLRAICSACGGADKACGTADDLSPTEIGFPSTCDPPSCGASVATLSDAVQCIDCISDVASSCAGAIAGPMVGSYPAECGATVSVPTATPTPSTAPTATIPLTPTTVPTATVARTATTTPIRTPAPGPLHTAINGPTSADGDLSVAFDAWSSTGSIVRYVWDFGHGTAPVTTTTPDVLHRFGAYGRFHVTLTVFDQNDASDSANLTIETNGFGPDNYRVTPVYFVPTNRTPSPDWEARFQTAMDFISRFYAENLEKNGFGYRPLNMERDANGKAVIRLITAQHDDAYYLPYGSYDTDAGAGQKIQHELEAITDMEEHECLMVIADVQWYDPSWLGDVGPWTGGRSFPGRGGIAMVTNPFRWFGTSVAEQMVIFDDPTEDSDYGPRSRGGNASILMGGMAHELGHAFGMQHTPEFNDIMALGAFEFRDYFVPVPYGWVADIAMATAQGFDNSAMFRSDHPFADNSNPTIKMLPPLALHGQPVTIPIEIGDTGGSDPALLHVYFQDVVWDSIDVRGLGSSFTLPYTFPGSGDLADGNYAYGYIIYDGDSNRAGGDASFQVVDSIPPIPPPIAVDPTEWVWGEDGRPPESYTVDYWAWQTTIKTSGELALYQEATPSQQSFNAWYGDYPNPMYLSPGDQVSAYLYIAPGASLDGIAIELGAWYGGGATLYWGNNVFGPLWSGIPIRVGDVPPAGGWVHLTVPASSFLTAPERYTNMGFRAAGTGTLVWDRMGKVPAP